MDPIFVIRFVTGVLHGTNDDKVVFGPPIVLPKEWADALGVKTLALEAWIPKDKGAVRGAEVVGEYTITFKQHAEVETTYVNKAGQTVVLKTPKLSVNLDGDYTLEAKENVKLTPEEYLKLRKGKG